VVTFLFTDVAGGDAHADRQFQCVLCSDCGVDSALR
jgi:hypothetical protein